MATFVDVMRAVMSRRADPADLLDAMGWQEPFPVGSVFISTAGTDPATLLGYGTWTAFAQGRVLVGQDTTDADFATLLQTGGSKT